MLAFSTLRILPRMGRMAWYMRSRAILALPPAESPSTIKISHLEGSLLVQLASLPLESKENFCFVSILVLAFSSALRIFAAFSAQPMTDLRVSRLRSKKRTISSPVTWATALAASWLSSLVLVWPSKRGSGCLMEITAVMPFLISAPVKLASLSLREPRLRA